MNDNLKKENRNTAKIIMVVLSLMVACLSLTGKILISDNGSVTLAKFESFYIYISIIGILIYRLLSNGQKANILILFALSTYIWTYILAEQTMKAAVEINPKPDTAYYIYFSSAIFLIIALFINNKKASNNSNVESINNTVEQLNSNSEIDKDNVAIARYVTGIKGIPVNSIVLVINNKENKTLDIIYKEQEDKTAITLPLTTINRITYNSRVIVGKANPVIKENENVSELLSAAFFGTNPILFNLSNAGLDGLFNAISNDYEKMQYNTYYEIVINTTINGELKNVVLNCDIDPKVFIDKIEK